MKKLGIFALSAALLFSSCESSDQFGAAAGGSFLGGIFGSAIGGLMGGPRGSDAGTVIGMIAGAAVGAASASTGNHTYYSAGIRSAGPAHQSADG